MGNTANKDIRRAHDAERRKQVFALRMAGASTIAIAKQLGYANHQVVARIIKSEIKKLPKEDAESFLAKENAILDALQLALWTKATQQGDVPSVLAILKIHTRRCQLNGYGVPKGNERDDDEEQSQQVQGVVDPVLDAIFARVARIAAGESAVRVAGELIAGRGITIDAVGSPTGADEAREPT